MILFLVAFGGGCNLAQSTGNVKLFDADWREMSVRVRKGGFMANILLRFNVGPSVVFEILELYIYILFFLSSHFSLSAPPSDTGRFKYHDQATKPFHGAYLATTCAVDHTDEIANLIRVEAGHVLM